MKNESIIEIKVQSHHCGCGGVNCRNDNCANDVSLRRYTVSTSYPTDIRYIQEDDGGTSEAVA